MAERLCPGCGKPAVYNPLEGVLTIMMDSSGRIWHKACAQQILAKFQEPEDQCAARPVRDLQEDLCVCKAATSGELVIEEEKLGDYFVYTCRLHNGYRLGHFHHYDDAIFFQQARKALPYWLQRAKKLETIAEAARTTVKSWTSSDPNTFVRAMRNLERLLELQDDRQDI